MLKQATLAVVLFSALTALATDLGVYGNVWDIAEPDLTQYIKAKLSKMQKSGELDRLNKENRKKALDHLEHPDPVPGITNTTEAKTWWIDPTFTETHDVGIPGKKPLIPQGYQYNPLAHGSLGKRYIFVDGSDPRQVDLARRYIAQAPKDRIVLTAGRWTELTRKLKVQVYYDQGGAITKRFGITHVPTILSQDGNLLKVQEILP
jgi:conjugal transfer pilus assembly protein TraW